MPFVRDENKRSGSLRLRLSPEMLERFEALAKRYGMPSATLAAFAIARFVQSEEMNRMVVMDTARQQLKAMGELTDERMEKVFSTMVENMMSGSVGEQLATLLGKRDQDDDSGTNM